MFSVKFDISGVNKLCDKLTKDLKSVKGARAGVLTEASYPERKKQGKKGLQERANKSPIKIWQNALIQEYGATITVTPKMRKWFAAQGFPLKKTTTQIVIPPRPFLRKALKNQKEWGKMLTELFDTNQEGKMTLRQIARNIGEKIKDDIQEAISSNIPPENSGFTIQRKGGSTGTLRDTGTLRSSIHSEVIK